MPTIKFIAAAALASCLGLASARAMPVPATVVGQGNIVLVSGGCGYYGHRTPYGYCVPNARPVFRACPPGYHLGPYRRECWPNR